MSHYQGCEHANSLKSTACLRGRLPRQPLQMEQEAPLQLEPLSVPELPLLALSPALPRLCLPVNPTDPHLWTLLPLWALAQPHHCRTTPEFIYIFFLFKEECKCY